MTQPSDIQIAQSATVQPIISIGAKLDILESSLHQHGPSKAKVDYDFIKSVQSNQNGKLILVTAISPTPAGEGKTTTTVGLGDALSLIGKKTAICLRDPSLGPCFGMKGGAANGFTRQCGFDITAASEIMAILCLATDLEDLQHRLAKIVVGTTRDLQAITAKDLNADGAMTALLKDALRPNLVQTLEETPAFVHGGPFANIAHSCNSVMATNTALKLADYVVTEAGFGANLGAEKFFNIKCHKAGVQPDAAVIVVTARALKMHGGLSRDNLTVENLAALEKGCCNLERHVENVRKFGVPLTVAINIFDDDTHAEINIIADYCEKLEVSFIKCNHWEQGGLGAKVLAEEVVNLVENTASNFSYLYNDDLTLWEKAQCIAKEIYGATDITADMKVRKQFQAYQQQYPSSPICMAKTQYSFSTDPLLMGAPSNHVVPIKGLRLSAGAEFIVAVCGDIMNMPGLPKVPSAEKISVNAEDQIKGLF